MSFCFVKPLQVQRYFFHKLLCNSFAVRNTDFFWYVNFQFQSSLVTFTELFVIKFHEHEVVASPIKFFSPNEMNVLWYPFFHFGCCKYLSLPCLPKSSCPNKHIRPPMIRPPPLLEELSPLGNSRSESKHHILITASYTNSLVHSQTPLFTSFASYSRQNIRKDSHTNIRFDAENTCCRKYWLQSEYSLKIISYWQIFASKYSLRSEYTRKSEFYIQANICIQASI